MSICLRRRDFIAGLGGAAVERHLLCEGAFRLQRDYALAFRFYLTVSKHFLRAGVALQHGP
jgi:hypothetical protein